MTDPTPRPPDTDTVTYSGSVIDGEWTWTPRELTDEDRAEIAAREIAQALTADEAADHPRIETAIADLARLLGDNTVEGSIRKWRATLTSTYTVADLRALADILITTAQTQRRIARSLYRLSKLTTRDLDSADVGTEERPTAHHRAVRRRPLTRSIARPS